LYSVRKVKNVSDSLAVHGKNDVAVIEDGAMIDGLQAKVETVTPRPLRGGGEPSRVVNRTAERVLGKRA
jgi:hypothetical protein